MFTDEWQRQSNKRHLGDHHLCRRQFITRPLPDVDCHPVSRRHYQIVRYIRCYVSRLPINKATTLNNDGLSEPTGSEKDVDVVLLELAVCRPTIDDDILSMQ